MVFACNAATYYERRNRYDSVESRREDDYGRDYDRHPRRREDRYSRDEYEDSSYGHGYYGGRERGASRAADPALYGHAAAGYAAGQRAAYDPRTLYSYFVHLERLRATNPQLFTQQMSAYRTNNPPFYRDLCARHYRSLLQGAGGAPAAAASYAGYPASEERTSVHSGRSSVNGDDTKDNFAADFHQQRPGSALAYEPSAILASESYLAGDVSARLRRFEETPVETKPERMTPAKFAYPHVVVRFSASGHLVRVLPNDTHKNSVLQFCQQKMREAEQQPALVDKESCLLIWQLLLLLIRQNGVAAPDVAPSAESAEPQEEDGPPSGRRSVDRALVTRAERPAEPRAVRRFTELLLYGHRKEALEWAMRQGIWGHALFLASKMDQRTYGQVMARFANGLLHNDPLQTLYQLMSGRQPSCTTSCADERWGDWRPHLAMILSNTTHRPELNRRAIVQLGDTLGRGALGAGSGGNAR
ncbi:protein transport protein Sec16B-like [Pollicipes pollicipes]|uniref:protein transport protein Sec16B-like n=1 Tax=Pollicipes pollicipes TaxID=41117 RepID=UPI001884DA3C|nr:protein transport protein Sec16B-like [Pollicipes pollicipes]